MSFSGVGTTPPSATALQDYCEHGRGNPLFVAGTDDDWYASVLPLAHLQYVEIADGLDEFVRAHPDGDFLVPKQHLSGADAAHIFVDVLPDHALLLSRIARPRTQPPAWTCRM